VLGGAVVADLTLRGLTEVQEAGQLATKPRGVQTVIAAIGPELRSKVLGKLVDDGHLRRKRKKVLGFILSESLELGSARRAELLARVRATLVDGTEPDARTAAITALLSASATLHQFDPEIPWTSSVIHRAKELETGNWGAAAAGAAVTRATIARHQWRPERVDRRECGRQQLVSRAPSTLLSCTACSSAASAFGASSRRVRPAAVSCTRRLERTKSGVSRVSWSLRI
jgi:hypothetical protein